MVSGRCVALLGPDLLRGWPQTPVCDRHVHQTFASPPMQEPCHSPHLLPLPGLRQETLLRER